MYQGKPNTSSNIAWHRPQSDVDRIEEQLIQKSIRALPLTTDPLEKLRLLCFSHGAAGIMVLERIFRRIDYDDRRRISREEFMNGIKHTGLTFTDDDTKALFDKFDTEGSGWIDLDDFLNKIRPPMAESRRDIVKQVFRKLDKANEGAITVDDIRRVYSVNSHPRYMSGEETAETILDRFLATFESASGIVDGKVTLEDFMNYYSGLSVSIEDDGFFDLMMRQGYNL